MAGLAECGSNPDVDLLYDINGLAKAAPPWFDRVMEFVGEYGLLFAVILMVLWCWWGVRRRGGEDAAVSVAARVWAPLAAAVAVLSTCRSGASSSGPDPSSTTTVSRSWSPARRTTRS